MIALNSILRTRSYQFSSNVMRCPSFRSVKTNLNPTLVTVVALSVSFDFSEKYAFHQIRLNKLSSSNIRFFR